MKNIIKLILINALIGVSLLLLFEFICYKVTVKQSEKNINIQKTMHKKGDKSIPTFAYSIKMAPFDYNHLKQQFRNVSGENYKSKSIVIFGCSFAYGVGLNEDETFGYKLSKLTKRPVYNRSLGGWAPQHILYQLRRDDFYKEVKNPEYFIYIFIDDHIRRMFQPQWYLYSKVVDLRYKEEKNGKFEEIKPFLYQFWGLYTVRQFQQAYEKYITLNPRNDEKNFDTFVAMMKESKRLTKKAYPNSKFVVIRYVYDGENYATQMANWQKMKDAGFTVIDVEDFLGDNPFKPEYILADGHPSAKAWDIITPALVKKLNLQTRN